MHGQKIKFIPGEKAKLKIFLVEPRYIQLIFLGQLDNPINLNFKECGGLNSTIFFLNFIKFDTIEWLNYCVLKKDAIF